MVVRVAMVVKAEMVNKEDLLRAVVWVVKVALVEHHPVSELLESAELAELAETDVMQMMVQQEKMDVLFWKSWHKKKYAPNCPC